MSFVVATKFKFKMMFSADLSQSQWDPLTGEDHEGLWKQKVFQIPGQDY